jgi:pilus assembly protein Flp/PilA
MLEYLITWTQLKTDRRAVTALEYGLIAGLIAVVIIAGVTTVGDKLSTTFNTIGTSL